MSFCEKTLCAHANMLLNLIPADWVVYDPRMGNVTHHYEVLFLSFSKVFSDCLYLSLLLTVTDFKK